MNLSFADLKEVTNIFSDIFHIFRFRNIFFYFISDLDSDDQNEEGSPGGKTISEVKLSMTGAESQAIAHLIVFSFIQRKRHPKFSNFLIPNILISPNSFRIIIHDAVNDILICSLPLSIFPSYPSKSLEIASIIILWILLLLR